MGSGSDFEASRSARRRGFGAAARRGRACDASSTWAVSAASARLSRHLRSRQETGASCAESGVPVVELRASIVIGSGSLSFEMIRALVERLPVMITPRWVGPGPADRDRGRDRGTSSRRRLDLAGDRGLRDRRRRPRVLRRHHARVRAPARPPPPDDPGAAPDAAALEPLARARDAAVRARRPEADREHSQPDGRARPRGAREPSGPPPGRARGDRARARQRGSGVRGDALVGCASSGGPRRVRRRSVGSRLVDSRRRRCRVPPPRPSRRSAASAGATGWYYGNGLWRLRGLLDLLVGGVGMRRGRRDPSDLVSATPSTSGGSRRSSRTAACAWSPR